MSTLLISAHQKRFKPLRQNDFELIFSKKRERGEEMGCNRGEIGERTA